MNLKNKRILITAGPTWVSIDRVRVISNIASGITGILLAEKLQAQGAEVSLVLGPGGVCCLDKKIRLIRFRFFDELKNVITKELKDKKYDIVIHSAAVSDYRPAKVFSGKLDSGIKKWRLDLIPTEKIINSIKKIDKNIFLVGFKFELGLAKEALIKKTRGLIKNANLDLAVANTVNQKGYQAYILNRDKVCGPIYNKQQLTSKLMNLIVNTI